MKIYSPDLIGTTTVTGSVIATLGFTGSLQGTASYSINADSASYTPNAVVTASVSSNIITFTKGNGTTFPITVDTGSGGAAFPYTGSAQITGSFAVTGSVGGNVLGNNTDIYTSSAAVQQVVTLTQAEYNAIGSPDANTLYIISGSTPIDYSSFATTGSNTFNGNQVFTGSIRAKVTALSISSNTASMDCSTGNFFTLQLVSGSNTFINPSNILPGQTINLKVATTGSGTVSFDTTVKQVSGSSYVPTTSTGTDIVTFISFDSSNLYLANVKNLV